MLFKVKTFYVKITFIPKLFFVQLIRNNYVVDFIF